VVVVVATHAIAGNAVLHSTHRMVTGNATEKHDTGMPCLLCFE
jgi:hypothetical protein